MLKQHNIMMLNINKNQRKSGVLFFKINELFLKNMLYVLQALSG